MSEVNPTAPAAPGKPAAETPAGGRERNGDTLRNQLMCLSLRHDSRAAGRPGCVGCLGSRLAGRALSGGEGSDLSKKASMSR